MTPEDWNEAWKVFQEVYDLSPAERERILATVVPHIAGEVRVMIDEDQPAPEDPKPGDTWGRYTLVARLGSGGMGEVFSARDRELGRMVAIKFVGAKGRILPAARERLIREAQAASALNHPHLVIVHEVLRCDAGAAIVTELVQGQSLRVFCGIARPVQQVAVWGAQIAKALAAAHAESIVHSDVKPENIMLRADGYIKIVDFGLAQSSELPAQVERLPLGTLGYMSPEQTRGESLTGASDVFSLGVTLLELATGRNPFAGATARETTLAIAHLEVEYPPPPIRGGKAFSGLLRAMLEKDPARRPPMADVAMRLEKMSTARGSRGRWIVLGASAAILAAAAILLRSRSPLTEPAVRTVNPVPFTTFEGSETEPAFSPDGSRIAFAWTGLDGGNRDIYVKAIGGTETRRLTTDPREDLWPVFSPDGSRIAFLRRVSGSDDPTIIIIPATGGEERAVSRIAANFGYYGLTWWPDGKSLLVRDIAGEQASLVRIFLDDGRKQKVSTPPASQADDLPQFSPDGLRIGFLRRQASGTQICLNDAGSGSAECGVPADGVNSFAWCPNSQALLYSDTAAMWRVELNGLNQGVPVKLAEGRFDEIAIDRVHGLLAFSRAQSDINVWRVDRDGKQRLRFIASSWEDSEPEWSPDGSRIVVRSNRSGNYELYSYAADGSGEKQLTHLGVHCGSARWSPDGKWIVFDANVAPVDHSIKHHNIFVIPAAGGPHRRLTDDRQHYTVPAWSPDSRWIYYQGYQGTWKAPLDGGPPKFIGATGMDLTESADGRWFYYTSGPGAVWRRPVAGGTPEQISGTEGMAFDRYWALRAGELIFVDSPPKFALRSLDLSSGRIVNIEDLPAKLVSGPRGMAVSPDGSRILYTQEDFSQADIFLLERLTERR